ncbi:MAG: signal peptidase II [Verrucomicrobiaceae bacterium]|nr:MAG: signal peptidase II [Verrucomicrobiaceae bacterium]
MRCEMRHCQTMTLPRLLLFLTLPLYVLDQITKFWTIATFQPPWHAPGANIAVIENFFHLVRVHNQGVAFGFGNGTAWAPVVFMIVPLIALTLIRVFWKKGVFSHPLSILAVALLLCGIFGNLTDRLIQGFLLEDFRGASFWQRLSEGYVVDFIAVKLPLYDKLVPSSGGWWPAFNVADSCICIAAVLLFIGGLREEAEARRKQS